jgi:hypothetical protein
VEGLPVYDWQLGPVSDALLQPLHHLVLATMQEVARAGAVTARSSSSSTRQHQQECMTPDAGTSGHDVTAASPGISKMVIAAHKSNRIQEGQC